MFIERSAARIRVVRSTFLVAGLAPALALAALAIHRGSVAHRDAVRAVWQVAVGLPLEVATIVHPRPGVVAARGLVMRSPAGRPVLALPALDVESATEEDRLTIPGLRLDARAAAAVGGLAREWLRGDARHPRNCVIDVGDVTWGADETRGERLGGVRIECVAKGATRAIRLVHGGDLVRVVRLLEGEGPAAAERFEVEAHLPGPVPVAAVAAAAGLPDGVADAMAGATVVGDLRAEQTEAGWSGSASGRIGGLELARLAAAVGSTGAGAVGIAAQRFAWRDGRLVDVALTSDGGPGWIDAALFDRLVIALGCRPGPAHQPSAAVQRFDAVSGLIELDGSRVVVRPAELSGGLAASRGGVLLEPPGGPVAFERLAWMVSPPAATFVPAAGPGAWLMSIVPPPSGEPQRSGAAPRDDSRGF